MDTKKLTVETTVQSPVEKVWEFWTKPEHITQWTNPSDDWHAPRAENDLQKGGKFLTRMEAKDGSFGFDFEGIYDEVSTHKLISYTMSDGRIVTIFFDGNDQQTKVTEIFDPENQNPIDMQQAGWQAILDNFKKYAENN